MGAAVAGAAVAGAAVTGAFVAAADGTLLGFGGLVRTARGGATGAAPIAGSVLLVALGVGTMEAWAGASVGSDTSFGTATVAALKSATPIVIASPITTRCSEPGVRKDCSPGSA